MKKVVITGACGMLGTDLVEELSKPSECVKRWDYLALTHKEVDITDLEGLRKRIKWYNPNVIVHNAAFTNVDGCENDPDNAYLVNSLGTKNLAIVCKEVGASMLYISTDYVFDGTKEEPYNTMDPPNPINIYGKSKLLGEYYAQHLLDKFLIVRTSWLFGLNGKNFVKTILNLLKSNEKLTVVDDQRGSPTYTKDLAHKIKELTEGEEYGIYHITNSGSCSWYEFALKIQEVTGLNDIKIKPIRSEESKRPATRPKNSVLDNRLLTVAGYKELRTWQEALAEYLEKLRTN